MIVLLDTSTPVCRVTTVDNKGNRAEHTWHADRELSDGLLALLQEKLGSFDAITGIGFMRGPGSFTGLRIGASVLNAIASDRAVPIIGVTGESWRETALQRLADGEDDRIVLPEYGREARITQPRK